MPSLSPPAEAGRLTRTSIVADLRDHAFAASGGAPRVGVEIELIPVDTLTRRVVPIRSETGPSTLPVLRRLAASAGWSGGQDPALPRFEIPGAGQISYEPGGQLEFSSVPHGAPGPLIRSLGEVVAALRRACAGEGIDLLEVGIDPVNPLVAVPLQLESDRYRRMDDHFSRTGTAGARMMRQTASLQVNVDWVEDVALHWRTLNAAAPYLVAIFANSPHYEGRESGARSFRALTWTEMDPFRTGLAGMGGDPAEEYARFALRADGVLLGPGREPARPIAEYLDRGELDRADWSAHLSTLFPEMRPKGRYVEVRCIDAQPAQWYAAPIAVLVGLTDPGALRSAAELLGPPRPDLRARAARLGLTDPEISRTARALYRIALDGAESIGPPRLDVETLATARAFFDRFTRASRDPGTPLPTPPEPPPSGVA